MTEADGETDGMPMPERMNRQLGAWFATEVLRAEADARRSRFDPVRSRRTASRLGTPGRRVLSGGVIAGGIAVAICLAVAVGLLGGGASPTPSTPTSTLPAVSPSAQAGIVIGADGLPTSINGEPVMTVRDAVARDLASTDASPFLVAGWADYAKAACPSTLARPALLDVGPCGRGPVLYNQPVYGPTGVAQVAALESGSLEPVFLDGSGPPVPPAPTDRLNLALALRIHTHDRTAVTCPPALRSQCDFAAVVDAVEWQSNAPAAPSPNPSVVLGANGIPISLAGELVLNPSDGYARAVRSGDATTFLVGGWLVHEAFRCRIPRSYQAADA